MGALTHLLDGGLGCAEQLADLAVLEFRMVAHQPENGVGPVLAFGQRRVARPLAFGCRDTNLGVRQSQLVGRIGLALFDFRTRDLAADNRIQPLDALRCLIIGNRADFQRVQAAEFRNLVEGEGGVVNQPDGGRFGHQRFVGHLMHSFSLARFPERAVAGHRNEGNVAP